MDLIFEKKEQYFGKDAAWVSEFEVASDFNLHVERISGGRFLVYQKSVADGEYDLVDGLGYKDHKDTIDMDFVALVYPKYIKVVSEAEVTRAVVLPEGVAKQIGGVKTEYDASIYEDRKALWEYFDAFGMQQDERVTLEKEIAVTNTTVGDVLVYEVGKVYTGGIITMWNNVEVLNLHDAEDEYEITAE